MSGRLQSLDLLRGADMFLLTVLGPLVKTAGKCGWLPEGVFRQFRHTAWGGCTLWDVIMPLFIFACGAAIPFSLTKRLENGRPTRVFWTHILKRFALLWILGGLIQCDWLSFDPMQMRLMYNTLQAIAVGYVMTALVLLIPSRRAQIAVPIVLAAVYALLVHLLGDYSKTGNFTYVFEMKVLAAIFPPGSRALTGGYDTWFVPSLAFGAMTMCGYESALVLKGTASPRRKLVRLAALAAALFAAYFLLRGASPAIAQFFSPSFCCLTMGWSVLALAVFYLLFDVLPCARAFGFLQPFGRFALAAYLLKTLFGPALQAFADRLTVGCPRLFGAAAVPFVSQTVFVAELILLLLLWQKYKTKGAHD